MVPNHLFQLLAMIGMEPPTLFDADAVRAKKMELLQAIHSISAESAVRGQYGNGVMLSQRVQGYRHEPNVAPDSGTETYVARSMFRQAPYALFRDTPVERLPANVLTLRIQPDEGLSVSFSVKRPGTEIEIDGVVMDFAYRDYFQPVATVGYETLIYDCLIGDATLFQRADTVEAAWRAVLGLIDSWTRDRATDFPNYAAGSAGPAAANRLLARDGRAWLPISTDNPHTVIRPDIAAPVAAKVTP
jgi:glucose-6-phosphate 1-dehydrogenase